MAESRRAGTFLLAIMTLGVGVLLGVYGPRLLKGREEPKPLPDVITQVRELSRLEGVSYHVERVVDLLVTVHPHQTQTEGMGLWERAQSKQRKCDRNSALLHKRME